MRFLILALLLLLPLGACASSKHAEAACVPTRLNRPDGTYHLLTSDDFYRSLAELHPYDVIEYHGHKYVRDRLIGTGR